jgi:hypothetical protein
MDVAWIMRKTDRTCAGHASELDGWHHLVIGDESWFFLNTAPRRMWTLSRHDMVTKPRLDIQSDRFMFRMIWNPSSFYIVDRLPNDTKMNGNYFVTVIYIPFEQAIFPKSRWKRPVARRRGLLFHNARDLRVPVCSSAALALGQTTKVESPAHLHQALVRCQALPSSWISSASLPLHWAAAAPLSNKSYNFNAFTGSFPSSCVQWISAEIGEWGVSPENFGHSS